MNLSTIFGWSSAGAGDMEIPDIYPFSFKELDFITADTLSIFSKILTDVLARTHGIKDELVPLLWDNCVQSEQSEGLITMLSKAMADKKDLFLVYEPALELVRRATSVEEQSIRNDYKTKGKSTVGIYVSFKNYTKTDMLKLYSALEYSTVAALSKQMLLSKAIQIKMSELRASVSLSDSATAKAQAKVMAEALGEGRDILMDAKDMIETSKPDLTSTQAAMEFIVEKRSFYLDLPASYITGAQTKSMSDTGEGDAKALERGLRGYYFSIIKPVLEALFNIKTTFKSDDFRMLDTALTALKSFELSSGELLSKDNQRIIINKLVGLPENEQGDELEEPVEAGLDPKSVDPKLNGKGKPPFAKKAE